MYIYAKGIDFAYIFIVSRLDLELFRQFGIFALDFIAYRPISTSNYHVLLFFKSYIILYHHEPIDF